jgi:ABC-type branched-subunit amino acid transport system substrate-binding protein
LPSVIADWAVRNGAKKIITIVNDWAPGLEAEGIFKDRIAKGGAQILASLRVPLANPDFSPFLQRARDLGPDTLFVVFPGNQAGVFAKQFLERGMDKSGIRLIGADDQRDGLADPRPRLGQTHSELSQRIGDLLLRQLLQCRILLGNPPGKLLQGR